ncbi:MAG: protein phosphatase 2C domain-containing protein [Microscillaceae bacterium]|nr:protein phosphatase 2C domain-containing protein [Microscillaceae bacterium]
MAKHETKEISGWLVVGASVPGHAHLKNNTPCQDHNFIEPINAYWGITVVADGAGSVESAYKGSEFLTKESAILFKELIIQEKWHQQSSLPSSEIWKAKAKNTLLEIRRKLEIFAIQEKTDIKNLSSTLIVLIYSPLGLLVTHIGDGRCGYCNRDMEWKAAIRPWRGEYANETVFMSSDIWEEENLDDFIESQVIHETPLAFALMSDGCERHSFICNIWDEKTQKYIDPNQPFDKFFNPIVKNLHQMHTGKLNYTAIQEKWGKFLLEGNSKLKNEPDDKTMVVGIYLAG